MSSSNTNDNTNLLEQANDGTKKMVIGWIRAVFRQVCVQTLARLWTVTQNDHKMQLHITQQDLDTCERICIKLGTFWCQRLRDSGQYQVAEWVNQVVQEKQFWNARGESNSGDNESTAGQEETDSKVQAKMPIELPSKIAEPLTVPATGNKHILSKIRALGDRSKVGDGPPPLDRVSRTLDELGRSGQTEWPYDWSVIEQAAQQNLKRLRTESIKGRPLETQMHSKDKYQVVPKSLVEREQQQSGGPLKTDEQQEIDAILASSEKLNMMVERKRKAAAGPSGKVDLARPPPTETGARPPSFFGNNERLSWKDDVLASLSERDRQELEREMIHPAQAADEEAQVELHSILGALKDVGSYHLHVQNKDDTRTTQVNDAKKRRLERKARKQRVYPHELAKQGKEARGAVTKVVRTIDRNEQDWMELDMGNSLLEIVTGGQKKLYAFSSLEVMLRDCNEMASSESEEEQEAPGSLQTASV